MPKAENAVDFETTRWVWGTDATERRMLHILLRVQDLERSIRFYEDGLGMNVLNRVNITPARVTVAVVGFNDYAEGGLIELSCRWDNEAPYSHGTGFDHFSIGVPDTAAAVRQAQAAGAEVIMPPTEYLGKGPCMAMVRDPDGYQVEFLQTVRD